MKTIFLLAIVLFNPFTLSAQDQSLDFLTFNIRYDNPKDGENAWPNRKEMVANTIQFSEVDVVGMQEALKHQIKDLEKLLPKHYEWIGVGRTDGKKKGEYSPIFYNNEKLELLNLGTFWLSEDYEKVGSKGWDAALPRIVTWAKFKAISTGQMFYVYNTHFDHLGKIARIESAKLILERMEASSENLPVVLLGDFNVTPETEAYAILNQNLKDVKNSTVQRWFGAAGTFNGFGNPPETWRRIDYIFVNEKVEVLKAGTLSISWDGKYASDHFPVFAQLKLQSE